MKDILLFVFLFFDKSFSSSFFRARSAFTTAEQTEAFPISP
jgi:hypothetical protein